MRFRFSRLAGETDAVDAEPRGCTSTLNNADHGVRCKLAAALVTVYAPVLSVRTNKHRLQRAGRAGRDVDLHNTAQPRAHRFRGDASQWMCSARQRFTATTARSPAHSAFVFTNLPNSRTPALLVCSWLPLPAWLLRGSAMAAGCQIGRDHTSRKISSRHSPIQQQAKRLSGRQTCTALLRQFCFFAVACCT